VIIQSIHIEVRGRGGKLLSVTGITRKTHREIWPMLQLMGEKLVELEKPRQLKCLLTKQARFFRIPIKVRVPKR
jgi:hypothetical protein